MNNRKILSIVLIIICIVVIIIILNNKNNKESFNYISNALPLTIDEVTISNIEKDLQNAIEECRKMYNKYGSKNFDIYFSIDFINNYLSNERITLVKNEIFMQNDFVEIYDNVGKKIEQIPELNYEKDFYKMEIYKNYLVKVYSYNNSYTYYYMMTIDKAGYATFELKFYTIGENDSMIEPSLDVINIESN